MLARLCPLFSGSKGNSIYVGDEKGGVLIDVGRSAKQIEKALLDNKININSIKAIFLTHEHSDHVCGVRVLASRYNLPVFASNGTISAIKKMGIDGKFPLEVIDKEEKEICNLRIKSFKTPHDSIESTGYTITMSDGKKAVVATDIGYMSDEVKNAIIGADTVVIESNHDVGMLQNGSYPYFLKRRILSDIGHLSNEKCAEMLPFFVEKGSKNFILAHLSQENNLPDLAFQTAKCALSLHKMIEKVDFNLHVAPVQNFGSVDVVF